MDQEHHNMTNRKLDRKKREALKSSHGPTAEEHDQVLNFLILRQLLKFFQFYRDHKLLLVLFRALAVSFYTIVKYLIEILKNSGHAYRKIKPRKGNFFMEIKSVNLCLHIIRHPYSEHFYCWQRENQSVARYKKVRRLHLWHFIHNIFNSTLLDSLCWMGIKIFISIARFSNIFIIRELQKTLRAIKLVGEVFKCAIIASLEKIWNFQDYKS